MPVTTAQAQNFELRQIIREIVLDVITDTAALASLNTRITAMNARLAALPNDATAITNTTIKTLVTI